MAGWIKLHRSLVNWEWYDDVNCMRLLIHLLVTVNYEDKKWRGIVIKSGSRVTSWDKISTELNLSKQQTRTAMDKLQESGEITRKSTNQFQLISLVKWDKLQGSSKEDNTQSNIPVTFQQHSDNNQITSTKEVQEEEESKKVNNIEVRKLKFAESIKPLISVYGKEMTDDFFDYWTEPNKSNTKFRQELQRTWSLARRLKTWNKNNFSNGTTSNTSNNSNRPHEIGRQDFTKDS